MGIKRGKQIIYSSFINSLLQTHSIVATIHSMLSTINNTDSVETSSVVIIYHCVSIFESIQNFALKRRNSELCSDLEKPRIEQTQYS